MRVINYVQQTTTSLLLKCCDSLILRKNIIICWRNVQKVACVRVQGRGRGAEGGTHIKGMAAWFKGCDSSCSPGRRLTYIKSIFRQRVPCFTRDQSSWSSRQVFLQVGAAFSFIHIFRSSVLGRNVTLSFFLSFFFLASLVCLLMLTANARL